MVSSAEHVKDLVDGYSIYKVALTTWDSADRPATAYSDFKSLFAVDASDLTKAHYILAEFNCATRSEAAEILTKVAEQYESMDLLFDAVAHETCVSIFIFKAGFARIRARLDLDTRAVDTVLRLKNPKGAGQLSAKRRQLEACLARQALPAQHQGTILVKQAVDDGAHWSWERAVEHIADFDEKS